MTARGATTGSIPRPAHTEFPYVRALERALQRTRAANGPAIGAAAARLADTVAADGIVYLFGSGHSQVAALELSRRAGVLAPIQVIFDPRWGAAEHLEGYGRTLLDDVAFEPRDCLVAISHSGVTPTVVEVAAEARCAGAAVVALTSDAAFAAVPPRHSSGRRLGDLADVVLDTRVPALDGAVALAGVVEPLGPLSTIVSAALLHEVAAEAVRRLVAAGIEPPLYRPNASAGGREHNERLRSRYRGRIRSVA